MLFMADALSFESVTVDTITSFFNNTLEADVLRLDKISHVISGNKWFKLRYYLDEALNNQKKGILTFGGAWSNHIVATAAICREYGLKSIGIIRGEEPKQLSQTLQQAKEMEMELCFISRSDYQIKKIPESISTENWLVVNEGGYGETGAKGASSILDHCTKNYTHYCCAAGTGTMLAGIVNRISEEQQAIGISVMKNNTELESMTDKLVVAKKQNWRILHDYSFGGYAKHQPALLQFMNEFYRETGIPSDFVYTGKLFYAITDLVKQNYFPAGSRLLIIHSGGLQGNRSLPAGTLLF